MDRYSPAYQRYIKSPQWDLRRERYFNKYGRMCQACKKRGGPIHIHHLSYANLGSEPMSDMVGLCPACHKAVHELHRRGGRRTNIRDVTVRYINSKRKR